MLIVLCVDLYDTVHDYMHIICIVSLKTCHVILTILWPDDVFSHLAQQEEAKQAWPEVAGQCLMS